MAAATAEMELDLGFADADDGDDWFDALVAVNQRWLGSYARLNPSFGVSPSLLERNSLWMNTYFQKQRMVTSPLSKQAKTLLTHHQKTVLSRLRSGGSGGAAPSESEWSTALVEPVAALMFAASADRCPECQIESLLMEALELLQSRPLRSLALCSGFAGCVFRFLTASTETTKRILTLQLLVLLATDDAAAVVHSCKIAAQGQLWQPNMFIYTLQKRHCDNETICDLAAKLIALFSGEMPISSPIKIDSARYEVDESSLETSSVWRPPPSRSVPSPAKRTNTLPAIGCITPKKSTMSPHRPATTISSLYVGSPSPYSSNVILPIAQPPPSASEQARRSIIYSTPKEKAIAGDPKRRCLTPNIIEVKREPPASSDLDWMENTSPPRSPTSPRTEKKPIVLSEKYSWNPDCINSVSGFEWWWRSLPQHHASLEPTQKLKMVTKAAVRLHTKGEWERAVELYLLALTMNVNDEVAFRLRVNLGCAYEAGREFGASEAEFRAALRINPEDPYARFKLGSSLKELGRFDEAAAAYEAVLDAYPQAKEALEQLGQAREEHIKREEAERAALASARTARSPSKPGRRLHSRGNSLSGSLPRITKPPSTAQSPRPESEAQTSFIEDAPRRAEADPSDVEDVASTDLISRIETKSHEKKVDLRVTLRQIDSDATGRIRLPALTKLLSALCDVDETTFLAWLPHAVVHVDTYDVVQYDSLLDALDVDAKKKRGRDPHQAQQWFSLIESIKHEEAGFYREAKPTTDEAVANGREERTLLAQEEVRDAAPTTNGQSQADRSTNDDGPREQDLAANEDSTTTRNNSNEPGELSSSASKPTIRSTAVEEVGGYHSVSARVDAKRERARQETILRAERSRVVARKHLHCVRALQDIATRARRYLAEQYAEREQQESMQHDAVTHGESEAHQKEEDLSPSTEPTAAEEHEVTIVEAEAASTDSVGGPAESELDLNHTAEQDHREEVQEEEQQEEQNHAQGQAEQDAPTEPIQQRVPDDAGSSKSTTAAPSARVVESAVAAATRRVVAARGVAQLQQLAQTLVARVVPETLAQLAALGASEACGASIDGPAHQE